MQRTKVYIHNRGCAFKHEKFCVCNSSILMCGVCNTRLDWEKRRSYKHIESSTHSRRKLEQEKLIAEEGKMLKCQATVLGIFENQKRRKVKKRVFVEDNVKMCMQANITLEKICLRQTHLDGNIWLKLVLQRKKDLKKSFYENICMLLQMKLQIVVDAVFFLFSFTPITHKWDHMHSDYTGIFKPLWCSLSNCLGIVSDSARYMSTCFAALQIILDDHINHFKCWAHKVNLVGDIFTCEFSYVNSLVVDVKMAFLNGRKIKTTFHFCKRTTQN
ncbi:hypothetical protein PR048_001338 [Dryococelus australis]|uniref:C2H2-type domain-containing protein n=1 Tax=Dryococelus australis TaxID=614101 RepID=A0ABQ9IH42_9NEOP|nr:hypothetical protein PR048_001338 [Dryococelus australis]